MNNTTLDPKLIELVKKLEQKYEVMGQDISSYLDGLLYSDYLTYWDYIHLDTLLSLQNPKTHFPDEQIFIIYHQITELYFRLILLEIEQIANDLALVERSFIMRIERIIRYFEHLEDSFAIMIEGMDKEQFLKFRMALLPASGFQSAQYRFIEICSTDMINLVTLPDQRRLSDKSAMPTLLEKLYWRSGATELKSGKKTLTLQQFEQKYAGQFLEMGMKYKEANLRKIYLKRFTDSSVVKERLREYDTLANVLWPLAHMKSAAKYLQKDPEDIKATGGTNWQKYLPPRFQKIMFFPELWSEQEKEEWGKYAVIKALGG